MIRTARRVPLRLTVLALAALAACGRQQEPPRKTFEWPQGEGSQLSRELAPAGTKELRDGLAAAILIDVSGSMASKPRGGSEAKIVSARRAALDLVDQFARYAAAHPGEPVLLGLYEFSSRSGGPA